MSTLNAQTLVTYPVQILSLTFPTFQDVPNNQLMLLLFFLKSHTATLHSGNQALIGEHRFNDVSAILDCKDSKKMWTLQTKLSEFLRKAYWTWGLSRAWVIFVFICHSATNLQKMPCLSAFEGWQQGGSRWQQNYIFRLFLIQKAFKKYWK